MQGRIIDPFDAPQAQQQPQAQPVTLQPARGIQPSNNGIVDPFDAPQNMSQNNVKNIPQSQGTQSPDAVSAILENTGVGGKIADKVLQHVASKSSWLDELKAIPDAAIHELNNQGLGLNQLLLAGLNKVGAVSDDTYKSAMRGFEGILKNPPMFTNQESYNNAPIGRAVGTGAAYIVPGGALSKTPSLIKAGTEALAEAAPNVITKGLANFGSKAGAGYAESGAIASNLQYVPDDQSRLLNTIEGAAAGYGLGKVAEKFISYFFGKNAEKAAQEAAIRGEPAPAQAQSSGQSVQGIPKESTGVGSTSDTNAPMFVNPDTKTDMSSLKPNQIRFTKEADEMGIPYTKGDATQDFKQQEFESRAAKMQDIGDDLRVFKDNQQQAIVNKAGAIAGNVGGTADKVAAGADIQTTLRGAAKQSKAEISDSYEVAKAAHGNDAVVPSDGIKKGVAETLNDFGDAIPPPIISKLEAHGIIGENKNPIELTVEKAQQLVKSINRRITASNDPATKAGLNSIKASIDDAVEQLGQGSDEAAGLYGQARAQRAAHANVYEQKDIVQQVIDKKSRYTNYLDPQEIVDKVIKDRGSNLENIFKMKQALLKPDSKGIVSNEGKKAWDGLRGSTVNDLLSNSVKGAETGQPYFDTARFNREMERIGDDALKILLSPAEFNDLKKFQRVITQIQRKAPGAVNTSNTATTLVNMLSKSLLSGYFGGILKNIGRKVTKYHDIGLVNEAIHGGKKPTEDMVNASKEAIKKNVQETKSPILRLLSGYAGIASPNVQAPANSQ